MKYNEIENVKKIISNNTIYICGYGERGHTLERWIDNEGLTGNVIGFVDKDIKETKSGIKMITYSMIDVSESFFLISSLWYEKEICDNLKCIGVSYEYVMTLSDECWFSIVNSVKADLICKTNCLIDSSFKDCCKNNRGFIIGNGPSLTVQDLDLLKNEITFATNEIFDAFDKTKWRPTYYLISDRIGAKINFSSYERVNWILSNTKNVLCSVNTSVFDDCWGQDYENMVYYKYLPKRKDALKVEDFSENINEGVYASGTSVYEMYQFAAYFGIKEIYLIGMDFSFANVINEEGSLKKQEGFKDHASFIKLNERDPAIYNIEKIYKAHYSAKKYADAHGIKIYNATRGGKLEILKGLISIRYFKRRERTIEEKYHFPSRWI